MDENAAPLGGGRNVAVVLAHGVGEAEPGYAISTVIDTLTACAGFRRGEEVRVHYLPDEMVGVPNSSFPVFIGSGYLATGERLTFAELYGRTSRDWGQDASTRSSVCSG